MPPNREVVAPTSFTSLTSVMVMVIIKVSQHPPNHSSEADLGVVSSEIKRS
ncbi:BQ2448_6710 [Microbotryum intermedium]|uniref:BQ2448_6710 protein n=1 Tax=Microbotryum intermedium TaxID=269621 RepID=A0A238FSR6_9BASI|nr:BQ2448_6710 [Microbotryum intermedium]